jgi:IS4 transposase
MAMVEEPSASFPAMMGTEAALEGAYRLMRNQRVEFDSVLAGHVDETLKRCEGAGKVAVLHDTTEFRFDPDNVPDLGYLDRDRRGFFGHFSLAVEVSRTAPLPLGMLAAQTWSRPKPEPKKRTKAGKPVKRSGSDIVHNGDSERHRWHEQAVEVERALPSQVRGVHIMDREADSYRLFHELCAAGLSFVVRLTYQHRRARLDEHDEAAEGDWQTLREIKELPEATVFRTVPLSSRKAKSTPRSSRLHPPREMRKAKLVVSAQTVKMRCPRYLNGTCSDDLTLSIVRVHEPKPPEGQTPVEWLLATTEPVDSPEDIEAVVDLYRARWLIEEFFKALKTGCAYPDRGLESMHALLVALALSLPVAWRLLVIRALERCEPDAPAKRAFSPVQLDILRTFCHRKLPRSPTVAEAVFVLAELGGHLRSNGRPGWQVLGRAFEKLIMLQAGWEARDRATAGQEM